MDGRELNGYLNYMGMERRIRKLAIKEKLASAEEIAVLSSVEVCDLVAGKFTLVYAESDEIGLVRTDRAMELFGLLERISR